MRNMSKADRDSWGVLAEAAQAFTTGGHAAGYRLTLGLVADEVLPPRHAADLHREDPGEQLRRSGRHEPRHARESVRR